jgi:hypothetical protein
VTAPRLDDAVHAHVAVLNEQLGLAAGLRGAGQLEERPQRQGTPDGDLDQLLSRIGMIR